LLIFAATKAKAKWIAVRSYWDAYGRNGWPRPTAGRAERYDDSALRLQPPRAWTEDYVLGYPKANAHPHGRAPARTVQGVVGSLDSEA
jgi:hypothetical protein